MNLLFKKIFGGFQNTQKFETIERKLIADYNRYKKVENSDELKEYRRLFEIVKSADFKQKKKTLQNRKYKDTQESRDMHAFQRYNADSKIRLYYNTLKSKQLADFLVFKESDEYLLLGDKKAVKKSLKLKALKKYEKSIEYRNYIRFHESYPIAEYERLKEKISTDEFKKANAFWADSKRWLKTEECALEHKYFKLAGNADIKFFLAEEPKRFEWVEKVQLAFREDFAWKKLDETKWKAGFFYSNPNLKSVHSFLNERQANTGGANIFTGKELTIATKIQNFKSPTWHPTKGFIEKDYEFTSDVINGSEVFGQKGGFIRAKIRFSGSPNHAFWLTNGEKTPHINIMLGKGKTVEVGVHDKNGNCYSSKIRGFTPSKYHVYSLYWTENELVWLINNVVVFRANADIKEKLFPVFNSFIPSKKHASEGKFQVKWLEFYSFLS
ncbi:MAG: family 16 glycosylhydrolase [Prevotellaceae bacterium]|jgi:hypothetical protein|nr:family 16 glycosylhydrolase [Prevotellaceae bacterium]